MTPKIIYQCTDCHKYTLETDKCPSCKGEVSTAHPAPFSGSDKWGKYRRKAKRTSMEGKDKN